MDKFMKDNFANTWRRWDLEKQGHIDETMVIPFMRELMTSMSPAVGPLEPNPYSFNIVNGKIVPDAKNAK